MNKYLCRGLLLEYEDAGKGIPLVFLHGMGGSVDQIKKVYDPIDGVRLITPNQEGHGESKADWEYYDFEHLADDVVALLEHLSIEKACFAGISMGAAVCLNLAIRYPKRVKALLLIRNAWTDEPMSEDVCRAYADMGNCLKEGGLESFYQTEGWKIVNGTSDYTRTAFTGTFGDKSCEKFWEKYLILPKKTPISSEKALEDITVPVTILSNKNDLCHPFEYGEYFHKRINGSEHVEIPDKDTDSSGHRKMINEALVCMMTKSRESYSI